MIDVGRPGKKRVLHLIGLLVLAAVVAPFVVFTVPQVVTADQSYVVLSDSMEPTISAGDVVVVNSVPTESIGEGDVITFRRGRDSVVTHRVIEVQETDGQRSFRTRGDANEDADLGTVQPSSVVGEVMFSIPYLGYVVSFASTKYGLLLLVIVPGFLLVVTELWDLFRAARAPEEAPEEEAATGEGD